MTHPNPCKYLTAYCQQNRDFHTQVITNFKKSCYPHRDRPTGSLISGAGFYSATPIPPRNIHSKPYIYCSNNNMGTPNAFRDCLGYYYNDGHVGPCTINHDSKLKHKYYITKPCDKFAESVTTGRMHLLPKYIKPIKNARFLVSTTLRVNPYKVKNSVPPFIWGGIQTRHYNRMNDLYYKKTKDSQHQLLKFKSKKNII